jgi:Smg protein
MFELLVYMFENYIETDIRADEKTLTRELSAAGFDSDDISRAFSWFTGLADLADQAGPEAAADKAAYRIFTPEESKKIGQDSRSFLLFLEQATVLNTLEREVVIDRLMALPDMEVGLDQAKWIALMVLWRHGKARDYLFVEDALFNDSRPTIH